jgi:hypothetical protein
MALVSNVTKEVTVPGEDVVVVLRKLSHKQLNAAAKARQSEGVGFMREMGGELLKALRDADTAAINKIQETQEAVISNYDRDSLLRFGIASWGYPVAPLATKEGDTNGIDLLDEPTAKFLAEEIFKLSRPETASERKND